MVRTLQQIIMLKATIVTNTFLYYLKRLWVIGKHVPDSVYGNRELKMVLAVLFTILGQVLHISFCCPSGTFCWYGGKWSEI